MRKKTATKLRLVCDIVNWEHRYKRRKLLSGEWCLWRVQELMKLSKREVHGLWILEIGD